MIHYPCNKLMIFGRPGSGKSTYAYKVHQATGLPVHHLDRCFFTKNWQQRNTQEFLAIQQEIVNQPQWIIDGNCIKSLEMRYQHADVCLYFNYSRLICYFRLLQRRFWHKSPAPKDRPKGCKEHISWRLLKYMWDFEKRVEHIIQHLKEKYPYVTFIEINNEQQLIQLQEQGCIP